ncbi:MAG TPA: pro-sigmaK processing inhibitor BofA family protein [Candidatus Mediterraneibacter avicola]|nr:pro-sigmaK processing inhibitor BofA family protein [Candidatus Mediterraneibacter avicola]
MGNKALSAVVKFFVRAVVGMALIFFINQYVLPSDSSINVGMNAVSFLTSGSLGIPGVGLLYGIMWYQIL